MVGLMPAIMALTTCAQPCRRWAVLAAYPAPYRRAVAAQPAPRGRLGGRAWPLAEDLPTTTASRRLRWPSTACASLERQAPTRADDQPVVDTGRGDHADSGRPRRVAARRIGALDELIRFGHSRRGNARIADAGCPDAGRPTGHRTPDAHTGQRTPGRPHRTLDTGRVDTARVDPGRSHRTLDAGCCWGPDRLTRHGQLRISWATTPSGCPLGRQTVFLRTAPAALGVPCRLGGEATCQCAKLLIALSGSCSVASPAKWRPRRTALVCWIWMVRGEGNGTTER